MKKQQELSQQSSTYNLIYQPVETQGQCVIKSITPIQLQSVRYYVFCIFSILLFGIPIVIVYWYPKLKLYLYYSESHYRECTHFAIKNYDGQFTFVDKQIQKIQQIESQVYQTNNLQLKANKINKKIVKGNKTENDFVFFVNRYMKYRVIDAGDNAIVRADIFDHDSAFRKILTSNYEGKTQIQGYVPSNVNELRNRFGPGVMFIQRPGIGILFIRQILQPLYFFIVFTLIVWVLQGYLFYCTIIFVTTLISIIVNLYQTHTLNKKIYEMAYHQVNVNVLREKEVINISSKDIVPGDIVFLKDPIKIPFDGIVFQGSALLNQCALTGESVPVARKAQQLNTLLKNIKSSANYKIPLKSNLICEGTTLIQVDNKKRMQIFQKYREQYGIPVYVVRTNFVTLKGQLIRIISFPISKTNIFQKQSSNFLIFLFCIVIVTYLLLMFTRLLGMIQTSDIVFKFFDLVTITVPPGLPVSMTFGIIHAIQKLKKKDIYCVSPNKVIMGGLVDFICFDKTGTLTQEYMDFKCCVPAIEGTFRQPIHNPKSNTTQPKLGITKIIEKNPFMDHILTNMATNHTIVSIYSTGEFIGDPMQIKLFQFGQYQFNDAVSKQRQKMLGKGEQMVFGFESKRGHYGVVIRIMEFDSELLRMSVIAKSTVKEGADQYFLYTKGSPQSIYKICNPATLPRNYNQILKHYASSGFRVLGIAHRKLNKEQILQQRTQIQTQMQFDGFQVFQNPLKPQTKSAIAELLRAKIPCVMITGDYALTGCNMSYRCKIANSKKQMYIFNYNQQEGQLKCEQFKYQSGDQQKDEYQDIFNEQYLQQKQFQMKPINSRQNLQQSLLDGHKQQTENRVQNGIQHILCKIGSLTKVQICLTGSAFTFLFGNIDLDQMDEGRKKILKATKVYARAKPNDKARIVMAYQKGLGKIVSMCGDGANDCGALKQSDAGLSLSQTQASISAPFTSKVANVGSMVQLIKECRAGLVTNFSLFNIMALYSFIQYSSSIICQYFYSYSADYHYVYWDICGNFFFFMVFGYTGTADTLSELKPSRSLFTVTNLLQVAVMHITQLVGQILMIYSLINFFPEQASYHQTGGPENNYLYYLQNDNTFPMNTPETSIIFLFSNFMYIFSFIAFTISKPWRKQFYTNIPFMIVLTVVFTYSVLIVIYPQSRLDGFLINGMDDPKVTIYIMYISLIFGMVIYLNQKYILQKLSAKIRKYYPNKHWL